jgi:hypothetical protein
MDTIHITLQTAEWNQVIAVLSEAPYKVVASVITQIVAQAQQQQQPQLQQPRPNLRSVDEPA